MKQGVDEDLEEAANELLRQSFEGVSPNANFAHGWVKADLISPTSYAHRIWPGEVYNRLGVADASIRRGQFSRPHNPRIGLHGTKPRGD